MQDPEIKTMLFKIMEGHAACQATVTANIQAIREEIKRHHDRIEKLTNGHAELQKTVMKLATLMGLIGAGIAMVAKYGIAHILQ